MRLFFSIVIFFITSQVFSLYRVDSLLDLLAYEEEDSVRVGLYLQLGDVAPENEKLSYYQKALELSRESRHQFDAYKPFFKIASLKADKRLVDSVACYYDSALYYAEKQLDTLGMAQTYHSYGVYMHYLADNDLTLEYTHKSRLLYQSLKDSFHYFRLLNNEAIMNNSIGNIDTAKNLFHEIITEAKQPRDSWSIAAANLGIGAINKSGGDYEAAIQQHLEAYHIWKEMNDTVYYCKALNNLALMYVSVSMPTLALDLYQEILDTKPRKDVYAIPLALANMASIYSNQKDFVKANTYADLAIAKMDTVGSIYYQTVLSIMKGEILIDEDRYAEAEPYIIRGLEVAEKHGFSNDYGTALLLYAKFLHHEKNYDEALKYVGKALVNAEENNNLKQLQACNHLYGKVLAELGRPSAAVSFLLKSHELSDSLNQEEENKKVKETALTYELGKREAVNEALQKEAELNKTIIEKTSHIVRYQRFYLVIALVFLVFALVFLWVVYRSSQERRRLNGSLKAYNQEMDEKNSELRELVAVNSKIFSIISHDLRSPLVAMHSSIMLLKDEHLPPETKHKILSLTEGQIDTTLDLFDNLLKWSKTHRDGIQVDRGDVDVCTLIKENVKLIEIPLYNKELHVETRCASDLKAYVDPEMLKLIIRNLLSNAIKFTPRNGLICVDAYSEGDRSVIEISDSGQGITDDQIAAIFHKDEFVTNNGTENEKGSGLGLKICISFIKQLGGEFLVARKIEGGSVFSVKLPAVEREGL